LEKVPRNSNGELSSIGALKHELKACQPCLFWRQASCTKGLLCTYCHLDKHLDEKSKSIRPSKSTRERLKKRRDQAAKHLETRVDKAVSNSPQVQLQELSNCSVPLPAEASSNVTRARGMDKRPAGRSGKLIQL